MVICLTGHRPQKMFGYDLDHPGYIRLKTNLKRILVNYHCTEAISGMALGCDQVFAMATLELKMDGYPIKLHCAIPFQGYDKKWPQSSKNLYLEICNQADEITVVDPSTEYKPYLMQKRNQYMVNHANMVIAVWDGSISGTKNCIDYANKMGKDIIYLNPKAGYYEKKYR